MEIIFTSVVAFASSNLDDIFILAFLFGSRQFGFSAIVMGQFLGIAALIAASWLGSFAGLVVPTAWIGLLGLIPVFLGLKGILALIRHHDGAMDPAKSAFKGQYPVVSVASITIANGGDNIGIYLPLFATLTPADQTVMIICFFAMTAVWCALASYITRHPFAKKVLDQFGHRITPVVLILLGLYILYESGTFQLLNY